MQKHRERASQPAAVASETIKAVWSLKKPKTKQQKDSQTLHLDTHTAALWPSGAPARDVWDWGSL